MPPSRSMRPCATASLASRGVVPSGPIRVLTHLRYFGYIFNPVTFYYCFDESGTQVETILAEITNTPWKERHAYVLPAASARRDERVMHFQFDKEFHVSPFWPMDMHYDWRFTAPEERLHVHMENWREDRRAFDATLTLERESISSASLAGALAAVSARDRAGDHRHLLASAAPMAQAHAVLREPEFRKGEDQDSHVAR